MSVQAPERPAPAAKGRPLRPRLLALGVAVLAAVYLLAVGSTHPALSGGFVGLSGPVPGKGQGLRSFKITPDILDPETLGYSSLLWAASPGGEVNFGFYLHNRGPVPVTVLGLKLRGFDPGVARDIVTAGALLGPWPSGTFRPFHPVTVGPGGSVAVGLTVRVVCDPTIRKDARLPDHRGDYSYFGDATSPVVVRYRALGITTSQTLSLTDPVLIMMPYRSCR